MNAAQIAQLAIILAPIAKDIIVEGNKIITTYRENLTQEQINKSLELSKSATWPELDFKP
ncbi:MAG: hypothetical protein PHC49_10630 [Desulfuromonadaceae bacterium]|nr:hypothetical protein [Desulfuromonadaceae bacterium]